MEALLQVIFALIPQSVSLKGIMVLHGVLSVVEQQAVAVMKSL